MEGKTNIFKEHPINFVCRTGDGVNTQTALEEDWEEVLPYIFNFSRVLRMVTPLQNRYAPYIHSCVHMYGAFEEFNLIDLSR